MAENTYRHKFVPGHRKSQSLGKDFLTTHNKMRAAENRIQKRFLNIIKRLMFFSS